MREQICTHLQSDSDYKNMFNAKLLKRYCQILLKIIINMMLKTKLANWKH